MVAQKLIKMVAQKLIKMVAQKLIKIRSFLLSAYIYTS
jgi:hypothetical protein